MTEEEKENAKRNINRINLKLSNLMQNITEIKEKFKYCKIYKLDRLNNTIKLKQVKLEDIDFRKSNLFISDTLDVLPLFTYIGLIQVNNIVYPDTSSSGRNSIIKTTYMIANSRDIRYSKIPQDSFYNDSRDGQLPDSWNSINFFKKDIISWRLTNDVGIGENEKMFSGCSSWIEDRYNGGKIDWIFYHGNYDLFKTNYSSIANLELPIYKIEMESSKTKLKESEEKHNINRGVEIF